MTQLAIKAGQIWVEMDPRMERYVLVEKVWDDGKAAFGHRGQHLILVDALNAIDDELARFEVRVRNLESGK